MFLGNFSLQISTNPSGKRFVFKTSFCGIVCGSLLFHLRKIKPISLAELVVTLSNKLTSVVRFILFRRPRIQ